MNSMFSSKILVATGPKYKDSGCSENVDVEVEMIPPGRHSLIWVANHSDMPRIL